MTGQSISQPNRPPVTVFLRPSFSITTRDGELNVAVRAEPAPKVAQPFLVPQTPALA